MRLIELQQQYVVLGLRVKVIISNILPASTCNKKKFFLKIAFFVSCDNLKEASLKHCYFPRNFKKGDCAGIQSFRSHGSFEYHFTNVLVRQQPVCQCLKSIRQRWMPVHQPLKQVFLVDLMAKLQNTGPLLAMYQTSRLIQLICSYTHINLFLVLLSTSKPNEPLNIWTQHLTPYNLFLIRSSSVEPNKPLSVWTQY